MAHPLSKDETNLIKSASIRFDRDKTILLLLTYHYCKEEPKEAKFYRCDVSMRTNAQWKEISENLLKENPAAPFLWSMIGLKDMDYRLWYARRNFSKSDFAHWLERMVSDKRLREIDEFMVNEFSPEVSFQWFRGPYMFPGEETGRDIGDLKSLDQHLGEWMTCIRKNAPRVVMKATRRPMPIE